MDEGSDGDMNGGWMEFFGSFSYEERLSEWRYSEEDVRRKMFGGRDSEEEIRRKRFGRLGVQFGWSWKRERMETE